MNPTMLFLTQLLPLLVFVVIDALVEDVRISIGAAVLFAVGQLAFTYAKTREFDWFVLLDAGLIAVLGAMSIALKNELLFKVKPAIVEGVTVLFLLALVLAPDRFLLGYFGRMVPETALKPEAIGTLKSTMGWMSVYVALHIGAVLYTAHFSSRKTWAFVSGPGFYLLFIPVMGVVLAQAARARRTARRSPAPAPEPLSGRTGKRD